MNSYPHSIQNSIQTIGQTLREYLTPASVAIWSPRRRALVMASTFVFYILAFFASFPWLNTQSLLFGAVPVLIAAWTFGLWGGVLALLFAFLLSIPLLLVAGAPQDLWQLVTSAHVGVDLLFLVAFSLIVGHLRDLTLQVQAQLAMRQALETELREKHASLQTAQQLASIGSWEWEIDSNHVLWSDQLYRIYGLQPQEIAITYEGYLARVLPADRAKVAEVIERALHDTKPFRFYERIMRPDTSVRTLYSQGEVKLDAGGQPVRMVGACQDVTEVKQSETEVLRREAILSAVAFAAAQFLQPGTWTETLEAVLASLGHAVDANQITLFENEQDEQERLVSGQRYQWTMPGYTPKTDRTTWRQFSLSESGFARWQKVMEQGESIHGLVSDFPEDERWRLEGEHVEAVVVMPIFVGQSWWGYIGVEYSQSETPWSLAELEAFKTATRLIGAAIFRQQNIAQIHHQTAHAHALVDTASRLNAQLDIEAVLHTVCEETVEALDVSICTISLYDESRQEFRYAWGKGVPADFIQRVQSYPVTQDTANRPTATGDGFIITHDVQTLPALPNAALYAEMDLRTTINVLLQREGRIVGRLNIGTTGKPRHFSEEDLALLKGLANHAVTAIENARLYQESQRQAALLAAINQLITAIIAAPDLPTLLDTALAHSLQLLGLTTGIIWVSGQRAARGLRPDADSLIAHLLQGVTEPRLHDLVAIADCRQLQPNHPLFPFAHAIQRIGLAAAFIIPIAGNQRQLGTIILGQATPRLWNEEETLLMRAVGQQLNTAIERLYLRKREQERAQQLQQILDIAPQGMLLLDAEQRVMLANPAARDYLALLAGTGMHERLLHLGNESIAAFLGLPIAPLHWHEVVIDSPQRHIFEVMARPLQEDSPLGQVTSDGQGYVLVVREVTQERQRFEYLQTQERLATVGQLAAGIAHDFNNILTPILLYTDMSLGKSPEGSRIQFHLQQVLVAATRAKDLINQILAFGRHGTKQGRKPLLLQPIIKETLKLLRAVLPTTIEIQQTIDGDIGAVMADATQIHQVLMNLCTNAYHAMSARGGVLRVELDRVAVSDVVNDVIHDTGNGDVADDLVPRDISMKAAPVEAGVYVRLTVRDTGYGIDPATLAHIFDPFFTTKPVGQGTGMGLAMVYGIVTEHEGAITVESYAGHGSVFQVYLPQISADAEVEEAVERPLARGQESILVIDDEESVAQAVKESLENAGYIVTIATDSLEALNLFSSQPNRFDLVLTDLTMPKLTGLELVKRLSEIQPKLPIILTSGYGSDFTQDSTSVPEVRAYLMKPFVERVLNQTIRQVLDKKL